LYDKALIQSLGIDIFEAAPDPILLVAANGDILAANQQAGRCFGYTREELTSLSVDSLLPEAFRGHHAKHREGYQQNPHTRPMGQGTRLSLLRKDRTILPVEISLSPLKSAKGSLVICIVRDITERKANEEKLEFLGSHDLLTGLYNRSHFELELARLDTGRIHPLTVVMIDVNGLKKANDTLGHSSGDILLKRTALVLQKAFRDNDLIARIGGDEFAIVIRGECDPDELKQRIHEERELYNQNEPLPLRFAVGVSIASPNTKITDALHDADQKMYSDKQAQACRTPTA
jgi:diguanylate cyclase (GGDEF)-like protein/PAS domain S-box-containing protein